MASIAQKARAFKTSLVAILCLCGASVGICCLYWDLYGSKSESQKPIALVSKVRFNIKRKPASRFTWESVHEAEPLFNGDRLQSGPNSSVLLQFKNGTQIELGEKSLFVVDENTDLRDLKVSLLAGSFILREEKRDIQVQVGKNSEATLTELPVRLFSPEPYEEFLTTYQEQIRITFDWNVKKGTNKMGTERVDVSPFRTFPADNTTAVKIQDGTASALLTKGNYFWRVLTPNNTASEIREFTIVNVESLEPIFPSDNQTLTFNCGKHPLHFRWVAEERPATIVEESLEIASDDAFSRIVTSVPVAASAGFAKVEGIAEGQYFWRLDTTLGKIAVVSQANKFTITECSK
jgi:hypothetical protein